MFSYVEQYESEAEMFMFGVDMYSEDYYEKFEKTIDNTRVKERLRKQREFLK